MCLGIPGKIVNKFRERDALMGKVDFGGIVKQACLDHVPDVEVGQYVIVHVGFALRRIDEEEAVQILQFLDRMSQSISCTWH